MDIEVVYSAIATIERRKTEEKTVPTHACFIGDVLPTLAAPLNDIKSALNALVKAGRIGFGHTINDLYFYTKK